MLKRLRIIFMVVMKTNYAGVIVAVVALVEPEVVVIDEVTVVLVREVFPSGCL